MMALGKAISVGSGRGGNGVAHKGPRGGWLGPVVLGMLAAALLLGSSGYAAKKVTLTHLHYYWHGDKWLKAVEALAKEFMAENPDIEIKFAIAGGE